MTLLTTQEQLVAFCARQKNAGFLTVDTEFVRERTYWPKLCLVQVAGPDEAVAIDPLAEGMDLAPLITLFDDPAILKVFHAARQDLEIFYGLTGRLPTPLFDTQVAAMVCGYGEAASYETLASRLADAAIDKSSRFTDWAARPLSPKQLTYALGDVTHLRQVYLKLQAQLDANGRTAWVREEMAVLTSPQTYQMDPQEAWRRLKLRSDKARLHILAQALAAWRETEAQRLNIPRGRVLRDEALVEIIHHPPQTTEDLARIRGVVASFAEGKHGKDVLSVVAEALAQPAPRTPKPSDSRRNAPGIGPAVDLLKVLLKQVSESEGVATKLIATTEDLEALASDDQADIPALQGWRRDLFGTTALALKQGKLVLGLNGKKLVVRELPKG